MAAAGLPPERPWQEIRSDAQVSKVSIETLPVACTKEHLRTPLRRVLKWYGRAAVRSF